MLAPAMSSAEDAAMILRVWSWLVSRLSVIQPCELQPVCGEFARGGTPRIGLVRGAGKTLCITAALVILYASNALAGNIKIHNDSDYRIDEVYFSPHSAETFGVNRLGDDQTIEPSQTWTFPFRAGSECVWDFLVIFRDGVRRTLYAQDLCKFDDPEWTIRS